MVWYKRAFDIFIFDSSYSPAIATVHRPCSDYQDDLEGSRPLLVEPCGEEQQVVSHAEVS